MKNPAIAAAILIVLILAAQPAKAAPSFLVEPYLQSPSTDGMTVMWETLDDGSALEFWKDGETPVTVSAQKVPGRDICFVALEGLESNTLYNYRVITDQGTDETYRFKTWPADGDDVEEFKIYIKTHILGDPYYGLPEWATEVEESVLPIVRHLVGSNLINPQCGYELQNDNNEIIGEFELAWPQRRVGVWTSRGNEKKVDTHKLGWLAYDQKELQENLSILNNALGI